MQALAKSLTRPLFYLLALTVLGQCGRKSRPQASTTPDAAPYVPSAWDGTSDWPANALKVEDLSP